MQQYVVYGRRPRVLRRGRPRNATVAIPISIKNVNDAPIIDAPAMLEVRGEERFANPPWRIRTAACFP